MYKPTLLPEGNLSEVWAMTFLETYNRPKNNPLTDLTVSFNVYGEGGINFANEIPELRVQLDQVLNAHNLPCIKTVASTIFPESMIDWSQGSDTEELYIRYSNIWPRISQVKANRNGTYFQRMIAFGWEEEDKKHEASLLQGKRINQLQHVIDTYKQGIKRRSAFVISIFNPFVDHTNLPRQGFPCLQNVHFMPEGPDLVVTGVYATQLCVEKAYGNYLGLLNLGKFMAKQMGLELRQVRCKASRVNLTNKATKQELEELKNVVAKFVRKSEGK